MRSKGKITAWNDDRGFGFLIPNTGGKQVFIHIKAFNHRNRRPEIGQIVTYTLSTDKQGRPCATQAILAGDRGQIGKRSRSGVFSILFAVVFLAVVGLSAATARTPLPIFALYLAVSIFTFILYALDKSAAKSGAWRTEERTLHLLSLAGGWPGALIAQQRLRHKSSKQSFQFTFWLTVLLNCALFMWIHTSTGSVVLKSFINRVI
ncbi:MAG: DUF1294 domain-containing protein [Sedimenticola selenatireducens]|uniref:DUF1294 domain-containing protein n=2 Tax=Sedimenticola selenatireducens TaxID=191960 RepID=A0A558DW18_9GAMM|nr:DUF1294 domain-containing protein [Sedimenticola selenatireducens]TVO77938.1 DUF1294 domain-containing protein [Sedimenticola selenatireducens]TVT65244.1 MAG: DUF1294 domain-containing protein [Sedimenticola selenatireducens]